MTEEKDKRVYDAGDVVGDLECVGVTYQESEEHGRFGFTYQFKLKSEVDEAREADAKLAEEIAEREAETAKAKAREEARLAAEAEEEKAHRNTEVDEQE